MAAPPISACSNSNLMPAAWPTASRTRTASAVTSWPMPSPGRTAMREVAISGPDFFHPLARRLDHAVECAQIGPGAGLDDVRRRAATRHDGAVEVDLHRQVADGTTPVPLMTCRYSRA